MLLRKLPERAGVPLLRLAVYTAILAAGGIGAAILETNPGAPLLVAGAVVTVWGVVLTIRFVKAHPVLSVWG